MTVPANGAVPQCDPGANYRASRQEIDTALSRVLNSGWYVLGEEVASFEAEFAAYHGAGFAVGVANGTDAVELALRACGVQAGQPVYTVSHTAVATVTAIVRIGARPVLVDVEESSYTMNPGSLHATIKHHGGGPGAIVPVHLYGHPADMDSISAIASEHGLKIVEDCAQAHGAEIGGRKVGTWGDAAAFSFYPTKNLGAFGDGGAVLASTEELAERTKTLRQYGWRKRFISEAHGTNSRLDELQAGLLRVLLRHLDEGNGHRIAIADAYSKRLSGTGLVLPRGSDDVHHVFHQYVIRSKDRDALQRHLKFDGIGTLIHYPVPVHRQPAYAGRVFAGDLHVTEQLAAEILSLPMFPALTPEQVARVTGSILEFCNR